MQFKKINSSFASINKSNSQTVGLEFSNEEELNTLEKMLNSSNEILSGTCEEINTYLNDNESYNKLFNSEKEIYFICYLETKLDKSTKRGAILKSISIGTTRLMNLNNFRPLAKYLLEEIFKIHTFNVNDEEKANLIRSMIEYTYNNVNKIDTNK